MISLCCGDVLAMGPNSYVEDIQIAWWMISLACLFYLAQDGTFIWFISFIGGVPSIFITLSRFQVSIVHLVLSLSLILAPLVALNLQQVTFITV